MKKIESTILILVIVFMHISCNSTENVTEDILCRCILAPTSVSHDTYLIEVNDTGLIRTSFGCIPDSIVDMVCKDEKIDPNQVRIIENVEKRAEIKLGEKDYHHLTELIENCRVEKCENPFVEGWFWDAWMVILMVGEKQFVYEKSYHPNKDVDAITDELVRLSPITVSFDKMIGGRVKICPDSLDSHAQRTEP